MSTDTPVEKKPETPVENKRGGCLTFFLLFMLVVSPLYVLIALLPASFTSSSEYLTNWPQWAIYGMGVIGLLSFASAFAIWKWKKWGVIGLAVAAIAFFVLNYSRHAVSILTAIVGIAFCLAILVRVVRPVWNRLT